NLKLRECREVKSNPWIYDFFPTLFLSSFLSGGNQEVTKPIIAFHHVTKTFEDSGTQVLKDINFELEQGKFYTLLGASGSGKSTILNIIAGLLDASSGDVYLDGK
ncbi:ATP-binding cassette domain-containing protein, partial [Larkinella sp. C7]|uniref:ATP-binding cassette domain-containing protein n=1 Tax=Larkinella sp. C7 TaxID=2576607 RepID=UPI001BB1825E